ncbi:YD repeat-containing protein [Catenovulum agarivorans DS-2]|uniref:YD repeat-containing protein n=1 Tax=Catenovulum agarivorans DS-2 TaxID=1328313 RepID=W7QJS4_9ALTE|nr:RHS repeat-associated core domain-containing protein [Catenovulum agarivorans]EWH09227.1 YD repeat-containing protein [Catenovulum agarivorans DS-2]
MSKKFNFVQMGTYLQVLSRSFKYVIAAALMSIGNLQAHASQFDDTFHEAKVMSNIEDSYLELEKLRNSDFAMLDSGLVGDRIDISSGQVSFYREVVSIPGNSKIPVSYGHTLMDRLDWQDDVPEITTRIYTGQGSNSASPWKQNRCTKGATYDPVYITAYVWKDYSFSNPRYEPKKVNLPPNRHKSQLILKTNGGKSQTLFNFGGKFYEATNYFNKYGEPTFVTQDKWLVFCESDTINHTTAKGEGFVAVSPNGLTYTFDRLFYTELALDSGERTYTDPMHNHIFGDGTFKANGLNFAKAQMKASKVEDEHGNWVKYEYNSKGLVTRIHSNDGREITRQTELTNSANQKYDLIQANGRSWKYYHYTNENKLVLPDDTFWYSRRKIGRRGSKGFLHTDIGSDEFCVPRYQGWDASIWHPSGAKVKFVFKPVTTLYAGNSNTPKGNKHACNDIDIGVEPELNYHLASYQGVSGYNVTSKQLELPDGTKYHWGYKYEPLPSDTTPVPTEKWVEVKEPDGTVNKHWVNRDYYSPLFGKTIKTETYKKGADTADPSQATQITEYEYNADSDEPLFVATQVVPTDNMQSYYINYLNSMKVQYKDPNGNIDNYITNYKYNKGQLADGFSFDKPVKVSAYREVANQQADERISEIEYQNDLDSYKLLLPKSTKLNGTLINEWEYFDNGSLKIHKQFGSIVSQYTYHQNDQLCPSSTCIGNLKTVTKPVDINNGAYRTTYFNDFKRGTPQSIIRPDSEELQYSVDDNGWLISQRNAKTYVTSYAYNDLGWLTSIDLPSDANDIDISYQLDTSNFSIIKTTVQGDSTTQIYYDALYRPVQSSTGKSWTFKKYNHNNQLVYESFPTATDWEHKGYGRITEFDELGRLSSIKRKTVLGTDQLETYRYLHNNIVQKIDAKGHITNTQKSGYKSPNDGNVILIESPEVSNNGHVKTKLTYNKLGQIQSITQFGETVYSDGYFKVSENQYKHSYFYDARQRLCRHSVPETGDKLFQYNDANELIAYSEGQNLGSGCALPSQGKVELTYTDRGLLDKTIYSPTSFIDRDYDKNGNIETLTRVGEQGTNKWEYFYNDVNLLVQEAMLIDEHTFITDYERHGNGYLNSITYPSGYKVDFQPNSLGQPTMAALVSEGSASNYLASSIRYHANGSVSTFNYANGAAYQQTLNAKQLPENISVSFPWSGVGKPPAIDLTYRYDSNDNIYRIENALDTTKHIYNTYDELNRLVKSTGAWGSAQFQYDPVSNLRKRKINNHNAMTLAVNSRNRVSTVWDSKNGNRTFSHDTRGNVTNNGKLTFVYNDDNQVESTSGLQSASFEYDGNLKRVKQTINGKTKYFVYTTEAGLVAQFTPSTNTFDEYIRAGKVSVARLTSRIGHSGNLIRRTRGEVLWQKEYMPFGFVLNNTNVTLSSGTLGYTGHVEDDSGLVYMQARYYDPLIGRFYSNDPVGFTGDITTFNRYSYVGNNPYSYIDPDGTTRYKFDFSFKVALGKGLGAGVSFTVDTESLEISAGAGGTLRTGAAAGFELSLGSEASSTRGNSAVLEGTADLTLGGGEESVKIEGKLDSENGLTGDVKLESALKIDGNGLNLNPQLGISAGVGGKGEVNLSIPETLKNTKQAISDFSEGLSNALKSCAESPGTAC